MKKFWPVVVMVLVLLVGGGIFLAAKPDKAAVSPAKTAYSFKKACQILTEATAKQLLGDSITPDTKPNNAASDDIDVTTCGYAQQFTAETPASQVNNALVAKILVRAAKSSAGAANNELQFGTQKPAGAQDVSGYGDKAYWNPAAGQLNILKNHNWYFLIYGKFQPADRSLDQTKQLADLIANQL